MQRLQVFSQVVEDVKANR